MLRPLSQKKFAALGKLARMRLAAARQALKTGKVIETKIALNEFKVAVAILQADLALSLSAKARLESRLNKL